MTSQPELQQETKENKMGVMPVNKLLISMSLPMMISMLVQALYNVVDSAFVARINENALTAVSLAFPVQNFMIAVASGTCVGVNALLSKSLGEKNQERADSTANNAIFLGFLNYVVFALFGIFGAELFFRSQTDVPEIVEYGKQYLNVCCIISFGMFAQFTFERLLQATGKTFYTMITQGIGAIINIILDPIFIFGYFCIPKMGVTGAAVATVIGQICAGLLALFFNLKVNHEIHISMKHFRPDRNTIKKIYDVGVPSIIMLSIASVMSFAINKILLRFSTTAAAVFGVYFKLQSFIFMPVFGLNNGMVPIISYNYGARKPDRIMKTLKLSITYAIVIMAIGIVVFQVFPEQLLSVFNASEDMIKLGVPALRIISISFIFAGFCIVSGSAFQALGKGFLSLSNSVIRQLVILVPVAYLLSLSGNVHIVWWAFPIAEIASVTFTSIFLVHVYKKIIKPLA